MPTPPPPARARSRLPPPDSRILTTIRDAGIRALATGVVQHALDALTDLQRLDESLYERFMEGGGRVADDAAPDALLRRLSVVTFRGLRGLLGFAARLRPKDESENRDSLVDDFDFGDTTETTETSISQTMPAALDLGDFDIDEALDVFDEHKVSEDTKWKDIVEKMSSIEYGLRSQLRDLEERLDTSLQQRMVGQALEALDDTRSSVSEGIFALISAVYQAFLPDIDPATVAPGHLTSLQRALLVRRGLTDLQRAVAPKNDILQNASSKPEKKEKALESIRAALTGFVKGEVFRAMRPADRWELTKFDRQLGEQTGGAANLTSEGLAKYLESLGSVNRREVLVLHDEHQMSELRESLAAARPLVELNTQVAADMVKKALAIVDTLYGRSAANDDLIVALRDAAPGLRTAGEIDATISTLELLLDEGPM
jgi:hypothetical protein